MRRQPPPSRVRYVKSHPTVSARLPQDYHVKLERFLTSRGISFADLVKELLDGKVADYSREVEEARAQERSLWQIKLPCAECGQDALLRPNSPVHEILKRRALYEGWKHVNCKPRHGLHLVGNQWVFS